MTFILLCVWCHSGPERCCVTSCICNLTCNVTSQEYIYISFLYPVILLHILRYTSQACSLVCTLSVVSCSSHEFVGWDLTLQWVHKVWMFTLTTTHTASIRWKEVLLQPKSKNFPTPLHQGNVISLMKCKVFIMYFYLVSTPLFCVKLVFLFCILLLR